MADVFVTAQRPTLAVSSASDVVPPSVELLNSTNPDTLAALERAYGNPITNDVELELAKQKYFSNLETAIQNYNSETADVEIEQTPVLTEDEALQEQLTQLEAQKSLYDKVMEGCQSKPFGAVCSFCTTFPNETSYLAALDTLLNKIANEISFRKVWKDALGLGDFDFIKKLGICILNLTRAGTAAINVLGMATAAAGDARTAEALAYVVLQRGGWMEPGQFINGMTAAMESTLENSVATTNICTYFGYDSQDLYSTLIPGLGSGGSSVRSLNLNQIDTITQKGTVAADSIMTSDVRKVASTLTSMFK